MGEVAVRIFLRPNGRSEGPEFLGAHSDFPGDRSYVHEKVLSRKPASQKPILWRSETVWCCNGFNGQTVHRTDPISFQLLGFYPYFAMIYGFAKISRFLDPLQARPSKTGPEL